MCYVILKSFPKAKETTELWNFALCRTGTSHHHFPHGEGVKDLLFLTAANLKMFSAYLVRRGLPLSLFYGPSLILVKWLQPWPGKKDSWAISSTVAQDLEVTENENA